MGIQTAFAHVHRALNTCGIRVSCNLLLSYVHCHNRGSADQGLTYSLTLGEFLIICNPDALEWRAGLTSELG